MSSSSTSMTSFIKSISSVTSTLRPASYSTILHYVTIQQPNTCCTGLLVQASAAWQRLLAAYELHRQLFQVHIAIRQSGDDRFLMLLDPVPYPLKGYTCSLGSLFIFGAIAHIHCNRRSCRMPYLSRSASIDLVENTRRYNSLVQF